MGTIRQALAALLLAGASLCAVAQDQVVYHINDAAANALRMVRNIRNHLDTDPKAKITVVAEGDGVDFLMEGAKDRNGSDYAGPVSALAGRGVKFEICELTLKLRNLNKDRFLQEADYVPSGVVELVKLQKQGAAYIKP